MPFDPVSPAGQPGGLQRSQPNLWLGLKRGVSRTCPACGQGRLFAGYLKIVETCQACGNDNEQYPSDDFAPYVTIFLVLHVLTPVFVICDRTWNLPLWLEAAVTIPAFLLATLTILPFAKGGVIGFAWAYGVTRNQTAEP